MAALIRFLTGRRSSVVVVLLGLLAIVGTLSWGSGASGETAPSTGLPAATESVQAEKLQAELPGADGTLALLVFAREDGTLSPDDVEAVGERAAALSGLAQGGSVAPPAVSADQSAALVRVPLDTIDDVASQSERAEELRATAAEGLDDGIDVYLTGPEGFAVDVAAIFDGADVKLLLVTVVVVALLLLVTYRSPVLWLVPLIVIGAADAAAGILAQRVAAAVGLPLDASVTGILSVLVFGAGTNYALLIIARYRDELRLHEDRRDAMARAVRGAGPAIIASGSTVTLALATLLLAELQGNRALGLACAIGIVVAMIFVLTVLPAVLVLFGRWIFWPYVPRFGDADAAARSPWARLGHRVSRRPGLVAGLGSLVVVTLAAGVLFIQTGLSESDQFRQKPEAVLGQQVLADTFGAGTGSAAAVLTSPDQADEVAAAVADIDGVEATSIGEPAGDVVQVDVQLTAAPETEESFATVVAMRDALDGVGRGDALVGGQDASAYDLQVAQGRDQALLIPIILVIVLLVLILLLRSLVAPVLLLATVVGTFFASLGASWVLFRTVFDFPAIDTNVILLSFLFLVALGVDYNIFLVTRAKEESATTGLRQGMITALAATGAVITSAGVLLAAVFAVLGVLPLITLTQIGIIVCVGVLLDTLLVRTVLVPALAFLVGDRFWWPRRPKAGRQVPALDDRRPSAV